MNSRSMTGVVSSSNEASTPLIRTSQKAGEFPSWVPGSIANEIRRMEREGVFRFERLPQPWLFKNVGGRPPYDIVIYVSEGLERQTDIEIARLGPYTRQYIRGLAKQSGLPQYKVEEILMIHKYRLYHYIFGKFYSIEDARTAVRGDAERDFEKASIILLDFIFDAYDLELFALKQTPRRGAKGTSAYEKGLTVSMSPVNISFHLLNFISRANKKFLAGVLLANKDSPPDLWIKAKGSAYWRLNTEISTKSAAIRDMVDKVNSRKYQYDCTNFAYFASLYVLLKITNDDNKFNLMIEDSEMSFYPRDHNTKFFPIDYYNNINKVPVGSRIYIQLVGELTKVGKGREKEPFTNMIPEYLRGEYCLKTTDDKYYALGFKGFNKWSYLLDSYLTEVLYRLQGMESYPRKFVEFGDGTDSPSDIASRIKYLYNHHLKYEVRIIKFP